jgi:hypothetical protein
MKIGLMQRMPRAGWLRARSKSTSTCQRERCENSTMLSGWRDIYWLKRVPVHDALKKLNNSMSHFPATPARSRTDVYLSYEANV